MVRINPEGKILEANDAMLGLTGYARSELLGLSFLKLVHPYVIAEGPPELPVVLAAGSDWIGCVRVERKGAEGVDRLLALQPLPTRKRPAEDLVALFQSVPRSISMTAEQTELAKRFSTVVNGSMTGLVVVEDGRIVFSNRAAEEALGRETGTDLLGQNFLDCLEPGSRRLISLDVSDERSISRGVEIKGVKPDGTVVELDLDSSRIAWGANPRSFFRSGT